jgi:hypothetical protein
MFRLLYARYGDDPKILHTLADRTMPEIIWSEASKALLVGVLVELIRYLLHLERASQTFELQLLSIARSVCSVFCNV